MLSGALRRARESFSAVELRLDRGHDSLRDLILHGKYIMKVIVALRPHMAARRYVVQLGGYADALALLADTTFDYVTNAELFADLLEVKKFSFVSKGRIAGDYIKPAQLR